MECPKLLSQMKMKIQTGIKSLKFVEFLEMIGRIADLKFHGREREKLQLFEWINYALDNQMFIRKATGSGVTHSIQISVEPSGIERFRQIKSRPGDQPNVLESLH